MSQGVTRQSVQKKVSVTLFTVMTVLAVLSYLILNEVVGPAFSLMRSAVKAVNHSRTAKRVDVVRDIINDARAKIRALKQQP